MCRYVASLEEVVFFRIRERIQAGTGRYTEYILMQLKLGNSF